MPTLHASTDIAYGGHKRQQCDVFTPANCDQDALVICLHGGWWHDGDKGDLRLLAMHLAERGHPAASVGYRLLGDRDVRDGRDIVADTVAGITMALEEASLFGAADSGPWLLGSGCGALLALVAAHRLALAGTPTRGVIVCGATPSTDVWQDCPKQIATQLKAFAAKYGAELDPMQLPVDGFPPVLLLHGDQDKEVPAGVARAFYRRLLDGDDPARFAVLSGAGHRFIETPARQAAQSALGKIEDWMHEA